MASCKKVTSSDVSTTSTNSGNNLSSIFDITIPSGFNWSATHTVNFVVSVTDARFQNAAHLISVYDADPFNGGHLIVKGSASLTTAFVATVNIPVTLQQVYVVKTSPDKSTITQMASVSTGNVTLAFGEKDFAVTAANKSVLATQGANAVNGSPDCNSGCTLPVITTSTNNVSINDGDMLCITGSNITVGFSNVNGGTVRVCGSNVTLQNLNLSGDATLLITTSGSANLSGLNFNSSQASIVNYGIINGSFPVGGIYTNYGTHNCSGDLNLNNQGTFTNNGTENIAGNFNGGETNTAINNGSILVAGTFNSNQTTFINNCSFVVSGNYNQDSQVQNYSLIKVTGLSTINSSTELGLYNGAMFETVNFILDGSTVKGYGSTSLVKISGNTNIQNSGAMFSGPVQVSVPAGSTVAAQYLSNGAALGNSVYIARTGCNGDGNGTAKVTDTDGDGVPDNLDDYPTDPTKAYNNFNPAGAGTTLAFEDLWPAKGDYDLNDVVVSYKDTVVTNAQNIVVQFLGSYNLIASGTVNNDGFGIQFPIPAGSMQSLTGATQESGQTNAVAILFTNVRAQQSQWNTIPGVVKSPIKTFTIAFNVVNGPTLSSFGLNDYNPFIWTNTRGRETHLWGQAPTNLADQSLFGTQDDNTNVKAGTYYVTKTGLPFGISIPTNSFAYPTETTDITKAYLHFADWVSSKGSSYTDWYSNTAAGYQNSANIYTK